MKIDKFEDFDVWKLSVSLAKEIYILTSAPLFKKDFGLRDQVQRAVVSVSSNIAEGFDKRNNVEFVRFLRIAKGSLGEVKSQLYLALEIGYLDKETHERVGRLLEELSAKIGGLISYLVSHKR